LFNVENEYNGVSIDSKNIGEQFYKGKGAGSLPTGSVVYSDLKALDNGYKYTYKKLNSRTNYELSNSEKQAVLISVKKASDIGVLAVDNDLFYPIDVYGTQYVGKISIDGLIKNKPAIEQHEISVVAFDNENFLNEIIDSSLKETVEI
jgi:homoserine dehydrogenase